MDTTILLLFIGFFLVMLLSILTIMLALNPKHPRKNPNVREDIKKIKEQIIDKR